MPETVTCQVTVNKTVTETVTENRCVTERVPVQKTVSRKHPVRDRDRMRPVQKTVTVWNPVQKTVTVNETALEERDGYRKWCNKTVSHKVQVPYCRNRRAEHLLTASKKICDPCDEPCPRAPSAAAAPRRSAKPCAAR